MAQPFVNPGAPRKRGNPNWGLPVQPRLDAATEFETQVRQLGFSKQTYADSTELRRCCERNRNRVYIPGVAAVAVWGIDVNPTFSW